MTPIGSHNPIIVYLIMVQRQLMCWLKLPGHDPTKEYYQQPVGSHLPPINTDGGSVTAAHRKAIGSTTVCTVDSDGGVKELRSAIVVTWPQLFLVGAAHDFTAHEIVTAGTLLERMVTCRERPWKSTERKVNDKLKHAQHLGQQRQAAPPPPPRPGDVIDGPAPARPEPDDCECADDWAVNAPMARSSQARRQWPEPDDCECGRVGQYSCAACCREYPPVSSDSSWGEHGSESAWASGGQGQESLGVSGSNGSWTQASWTGGTFDSGEERSMTWGSRPATSGWQVPNRRQGDSGWDWHQGGWRWGPGDSTGGSR
jgi:hypothetical protein